MILKSTLLTLALAAPILAQQAVPPSQMLDSAFLKGKAAELLKQAQASPIGLASETFLTRPESNIQMAVRLKSGQGEWHHDYADVLIVLEGSAQIITGGQIVNGKETAPGEIRGDSVKGGTTQTFKAGDVLRIEPQVAHQVLLAPGGSIRYLAVKVKANKH